MIKKPAHILVATGAVGVLLLAGCGSSYGEDSGCVRPDLIVTPTQAQVGSDVMVVGGPFLSVCGDTTDNGESSSNRAAPTIHLFLVQGDSSTPLGEGTPDKHGKMSVTVIIPTSGRPGVAKVVTDEDLPTSTEITLGR